MPDPRTIHRTIQHDAARTVEWAQTVTGRALTALTNLRADANALGWPTTTSTDRPPIGKPDGSIVERHAGRLAGIEHTRRTITHHLDQAHTAWQLWVAHLEKVQRALPATPRADQQQDGPPMCRDNQHDLHGAPEWGDPLCPMPATRHGLCSGHYLAYWQALRAAGLTTPRTRKTQVNLDNATKP